MQVEGDEVTDDGGNDDVDVTHTKTEQDG